MAHRVKARHLQSAFEAVRATAAAPAVVLEAATRSQFNHLFRTSSEAW
jgi:hypothetical protein